MTVLLHDTADRTSEGEKGRKSMNRQNVKYVCMPMVLTKIAVHKENYCIEK